MSAQGVRCGYVETAMGQVHYRECGTGKPLLLLHQPPRSALVYRRLMAALAEGGGVRAIAFDLPGFGNSCDLRSGTSLEDIANLVAQAIQGLDCGKPAVFGLHTGNKVAAALAAAHPDRVDRVALAGMTHSIILDAERRNEAMREYVKNKPPTDPAFDPPAWRDEQVDRLNARGVDLLYAANYAFDLAAALRRIAVPALVLELCVPQEERLGRQAQALAALMPHGRALQLQGNDGELLQRRPAELAAVLTRFMTSEELA